jgi:hypothetical protein
MGLCDHSNLDCMNHGRHHPVVDGQLPVGNRDWSAYQEDALGFARDVLKWTPDPKQEEILEALHHKRVILNWGRQSGKTSALAARIVHRAVTHPRDLVLIIGAVEHHIGELLERIDQFLSEIEWDCRGITGKPMSRRLPNGSRIVSGLTNKSVRGNPAALVVLDEASLVADAVWRGLLPTMASTKGSMIVAGTPYGTMGQFYEIWHGEKTLRTEWLRSVYPATENPRIDADFLDEMRAMKGENYVRQEFLCEFVETGKNLLSRELVEDLFRLK